MVLARDDNRLIPSIAMFLSYFLLGVFLSALGPAIPSLSRDIGAQEVAFGMVFSLRGLGHLLGSWSPSLRVPPTELKTRLRGALNNGMNRLGAATTGLGLSSIALVVAGTFWLVCASCFCQGFFGGAIDAIANVAMSDVHGTGVAPWLQGMHFSYSVGALLGPAAVGQFGYRNVLVVFGVLAIPASLVSFVADGGDDSENASGWHLPVSAQETILQEVFDETTSSTESTASSESDADIIEAARRLSDASAVSEEEQACRLKDRPTVTSPATSILPTKNTTTVGQGLQRAFLPGAAAAASTVGEDSQAQPLGMNMGAGAAHILSNASCPGENKKAARDVVADQQIGKSDKTALLPQKGGERGLPPFSLIALLSLFLFLYVGIEFGFGAWIAVVVLRDGLSGEAGATRMASLFGAGVTVGRLLAIPLAVRFSNAFLVRANLLGGLVSSVLLLLAGRVSYAWTALSVGLFGLSTASTFPLTVSLIPSAGFFLSSNNLSLIVIGGALGEMLMPALIAALMGPADEMWPAALYVVCVVISVLMLLVYGASCFLLRAAGQRAG